MLMREAVMEQDYNNSRMMDFQEVDVSVLSW
jgi:hypothetical protein